MEGICLILNRFLNGNRASFIIVTVRDNPANTLEKALHAAEVQMPFPT